MFRRCCRALCAGAAPQVSPWAVLGFEGAGQRVDKAAVRQRYLELAKERHPDAEGGSDEQFRQLKEAYEAVRRGGRVAFDVAADGGAGGQAPPLDDEDISEEKLEIRRMYRTFWEQQRKKSERRSVEEREAHNALRFMQMTLNDNVDQRDAAHGVTPTRAHEFRKFMRITSDRSEVVRPGSVLISRVPPCVHLGREYGEPPAPYPRPQAPAVVLIVAATKGTAEGLLLNRRGWCGPVPVDAPYTIHADAAAPGRRRLFAGLYTAGGKPKAPCVEVTGLCTWQDFELEREVSTGLWSVHRRLPAREVLDASETHLKHLADAPQLLEGFDVTQEEEDSLRGMLTAGVFTPHPWR